MAANNCSLHDGFATTDDAIRQVEAYMARINQSMRRETKETVWNFNRKCCKAEQRINELSDDAQYSQT